MSFLHIIVLEIAIVAGEATSSRFVTTGGVCVGVISLTDVGAVIMKIPLSVCLVWHRKPMSAQVKGF